MAEKHIVLYGADTEEELEHPLSGLSVEHIPEVGSALTIAMDDPFDPKDRRVWSFTVRRVEHDLRIMGRGKTVQYAILYVAQRGDGGK